MEKYDSILVFNIDYPIKSMITWHAMYWMTAHSEPNKGYVNLPTKVREALCADTGMSQNQLSKALKELKDVGLIRGDKGLFYINPNALWRGDLEEVPNAIIEWESFEETSH